LGTLVNLTDGGEGLSNYTFSKATIASISQKLKNRKLSEETKLKISQSTKGVPKPKNSLVGKKKHSEETKQKLRIPKIKVECPHCKKIGGIPVMKRYHFNNCASLNN
jgi:sortase (surface protein transpeptidase)